MTNICRCFCRKEEPPEELFLENTSKDIEDTFMGILIDEKNYKISSLQIYMNGRCGGFLTMKKTFENTSGQHFEGESGESIITSINSCIDRLRNLLENKISSIIQAYEELSKRIKKHMSDVIIQQRSDKMLAMSKDPKVYFSEHFSLSTRFPSEELEGPCLVAEGDIIQQIFMACLEKERVGWYQFTNTKYETLSRYRERYLAIALPLLQCNTSTPYAKQRLYELRKQDGSRLLDALYKTLLIIDESHKKSASSIETYMDNFRKKALTTETYREMTTHTYDYFIKLFSISSDSYDTSPMADPDIANFFMKSFVEQYLGKDAISVRDSILSYESVASEERTSSIKSCLDKRVSDSVVSYPLESSPIQLCSSEPGASDKRVSDSTLSYPDSYIDCTEISCEL